MKCFNCQKGIMYGHEVSHAKNRSRRIFKPNLHYARIKVGGGLKRVRLCTKCLRIIKKKTAKNLSTSVKQASSLRSAPKVLPQQATVSV